MRAFDPQRAFVKQTFGIKRVDSTPEREPEVSTVQPVSASTEKPRLEAEIVSTLKEITNNLLEQQKRLAAQYSQDSQNSQDNMLTIATAVTNMSKGERFIESTPSSPQAYTFEIERDAQGRISRVYANPQV